VVARVSDSARVVVVTGAANGIGREVALGFHRDGDAVVAVDIDAAGLDILAAETSMQTRVLDVVDHTAVHRVFDAIGADHGPVNVLVNNAGVMARSSVVDTTEEEWDRVMAINVKGVFNCCHAAAPAMVKEERGWMINVGSIWAKHAWPERVVYSASKAAVEQFTRAFALEMAPHNVHVNAVSPGIMASAMTAGVVDDPDFRSRFMPRVALGEVGRPAEHLVDVIRFLASPGAAYMAGEVVGVLGGYH
jgi:NAD(P)-dependent dehydrogenase (short-subunit alcohol dehydrogenase family)